MDTAIVIQGKIGINTVGILDYYDNFNCIKILSTYNGSVNFDTSKYKNFHIVLCDMPGVPGNSNRNCQRITSYNGIKKAQELGCKYVLKTRTDHFFKNPNLINILKLNINTYPTFSCVNQEKRIIVPNAGTTLNKKWGEYHLSDHWQFGTVIDILDYFNINIGGWDRNKPFNLKEPTSPEPEFCQLWMRDKNLQHAAFSNLLRERFIILDNYSLYYDIVKERTDNLFAAKSDWNAWCDPLTVNSRMWFDFYSGKTYSAEEELEMNRIQRLI